MPNLRNKAYSGSASSWVGVHCPVMGGLHHPGIGNLPPIMFSHIAGSRGHHHHAHPQWDPILFSHTVTVSPKSTCVGGRHPPTSRRPLQREILHPQLVHHVPIAKAQLLSLRYGNINSDFGFK